MSVAYPGTVSIIFDEWLPEDAKPAGYAALVAAYNLSVPTPQTKSAISLRNRDYKQDGWRIFNVRHEPEASLAGHLTFALKNEGVDLLVLKRLFHATGPGPIEQLVREAPSGAYARRTGFLYEWLTGRQLEVPDAREGRYVEVIDTDLQFGGEAKTNRRFRLKDNMPGTPAFCPLVRRTDMLRQVLSEDLAERAAEVIANVPADILRRAVAFLLLEDTKSTFEIEGERPGYNRLQRWSQVVAQAGKQPISKEELVRLQRIVLDDGTTVKFGIRHEEGFIGQHDRVTHDPIPSHISARANDLETLVQGLVGFERLAVGAMPAIVAAAALSFGFVFIHPFADGNGRLHRYLIHHVLARTGFSPKGMIFPVSSVMAQEIAAYKLALESYSSNVLPMIKWRPAADGNVTIDNDTVDLYRYFDATVQTEFLASCVKRTIDQDLPAEVRYLEAHDAFKARVKRTLDLEERYEELAFTFLQQGEGRLSKRARSRELAPLGEATLDLLEQLYLEEFTTDREHAATDKDDDETSTP